MMSKKLYDVVFSHSSKPGVDKAEDSREAENIHDCMISSSGCFVIKETLTYFSETVKYMNWGDEKDLTKIELDDARLHVRYFSNIISPIFIVFLHLFWFYMFFLV